MSGPGEGVRRTRAVPPVRPVRRRGQDARRTPPGHGRPGAAARTRRRSRTRRTSGRRTTRCRGTRHGSATVPGHGTTRGRETTRDRRTGRDRGTRHVRGRPGTRPRGRPTRTTAPTTRLPTGSAWTSWPCAGCCTRPSGASSRARTRFSGCGAPCPSGGPASGRPWWAWQPPRCSSARPFRLSCTSPTRAAPRRNRRGPGGGRAVPRRHRPGQGGRRRGEPHRRWLGRARRARHGRRDDAPPAHGRHDPRPHGLRRRHGRPLGLRRRCPAVHRGPARLRHRHGRYTRRHRRGPGHLPRRQRLRHQLHRHRAGHADHTRPGCRRRQQDQRGAAHLR